MAIFQSITVTLLSNYQSHLCKPRPPVYYRKPVSDSPLILAGYPGDSVEIRLDHVGISPKVGQKIASLDSLENWRCGWQFQDSMTLTQRPLISKSSPALEDTCSSSWDSMFQLSSHL